MNRAIKPRRRSAKATPFLTSEVPNKPPVEGQPHMVGYARVSMSDQSNQRQVDELIRYGVADIDIYSDVGSGKSMDRSGWQNCLKLLQDGDLLVVYSLDRLGRNLEEVIRLERELREKGVRLKSLKEDLNTATPTGRLMFHIIMAMAQWEREWSWERTMHGLQKARERGVTGGQEKKFTVEMIAPAVEKYGVAGAARHLKCSKATVIRRMKEYEAGKLMMEQSQ